MVPFFFSSEQVKVDDVSLSLQRSLIRCRVSQGGTTSSKAVMLITMSTLTPKGRPNVHA